MERIGIIGLGRMGSALARRLAEQGAEVHGWTRSGLSKGKAADLGITKAEDLPSLVAASDVVISSLFDDAAVAEVLDQLAACDLTGRLIIDTSTVTPKSLTDRVEAIAGAGGALVDAPIAGGPELVAAGSCGVFLGGAEADVARALTVLKRVTETCAPIGPLGTGQVMKCINNSMAQTYFAGLVEQLRVAKRAGVPLDTALKLVSGGPTGMPLLTARLPKVFGEDKTVGFTVAGIRKDNHIFRQIAQDFDVQTPTLEAALTMQDIGIEAGLAQADPAMLLVQAYHDA